MEAADGVAGGGLFGVDVVDEVAEECAEIVWGAGDGAGRGGGAGLGGGFGRSEVYAGGVGAGGGGGDGGEVEHGAGSGRGGLAFADGEGLHGHGAGVAGDGEVGFKGAGGGDEVGHFFVDVDVGHEDHAVGVGVGVAGVVDLLKGAVVFGDLGDLEGGGGLAVEGLLQGGLKEDDLALVGFAVFAAGGAGVGDVFGDGVEPDAFGV